MSRGSRVGGIVETGAETGAVPGRVDGSLKLQVFVVPEQWLGCFV